MKLLDRIRNLDASLRPDVVAKYMPVLLIIDEAKNPRDSSSKHRFVVGHVHSDLVEILRNRLLEKNADGLKSFFRLPPTSSSDDETRSLLFRKNRYFGVVAQDSSQNSRTAAMTRFTDLLRECRVISKLHSDIYPITNLMTEDSEILATVNRNAAPYLGVTSVGVHLLCYVKKENKISLWLAQRAANKSHHALRWDPTVAGGQPIGMGLFENIVKEAGEEAGIPPDLVAQNAVATGCLSQMTCQPDGTCMKQSLYYMWDMEVSEGFTPVAADGEVAQFELCSAEQLEHDVRQGTRLRPAIILVVTDFLIRHGVITPNEEPDYTKILTAMHRERLVLEYRDNATN